MAKLKQTDGPQVQPLVQDSSTTNHMRTCVLSCAHIGTFILTVQQISDTQVNNSILTVIHNHLHHFMHGKTVQKQEKPEARVHDSTIMTCGPPPA